MTAPEPGVQSHAPSFRTDRTPRPTRILVAEDEHLVATDLALTLGELGYTVVGPVSDGMGAVQMAQRALPEMALLDIRMPRKDGIATAEQLYRELAIPTVLISAYSDDEYVESAGQIGVFGYLIKPAAAAQIRACIQIAWKRHLAFAAASRETDDLRRRLDERRVIEQAKWHLVSTRSLAEPDAMKLLQRTARNERTPLIDVAQGVLNGTRTV